MNKRNKIIITRTEKILLLILFGVLLIIIWALFFMYLKSNAQFVKKSTNTPVPPRTSIPTWTPTITLSPTPIKTATQSLFLGSARSYIPSQEEVPDGYLLQPEYSFARNIGNGDGYTITYANNANKQEGGKVWAVEYTIFVYNSERDTKNEFINKNNNISLTIAGNNVHLTRVDSEIPEADDIAIFSGVLIYSSYVEIYVVSIIRFRNVLLVQVVSGYSSLDPEASIVAIGRSSHYFVSLVIKQLYP